ncbi:MAG: thiamine pyrophosphate-dependent enzyme [Phycisphaerales bacterium]
MPTLQEMAKKKAAFSSGHRLCAGCPVPIFTKMLTQVTDSDVVLGSATGCLEVASSIFPYSAWNVPWIHTAFENAAATMSGVEAMYRVQKREGRTGKMLKFVAMGGDGGTYDIGIQSLSAAMERGHDLLYICYDNGAYMNTGIQRSGATPLGAATTTTPVGEVTAGKQQQRKDLTQIMVAHHIRYVAQASIHNPIDLSNKIKKGIEVDGPAFLNILCPCIPGWRIAPDMAVETARCGVETCFWPLYEVEDGKYKINYKPKQKTPVADWLFSQGRFKHLQSPKFAGLIETFQRQVDEQWTWLLAQEAAAV